VYCRVIACDFDGTGATNDRPAPELYAALAAARSQGILTLLVTGRVLEDVQRASDEQAPFDAIVAENGAIVYLCGVGRTLQLGQPPPEQFLGELRARHIPFHTGSVVVGTWEQHATELLDLIRRFGIDAQIIFNRAAVMVLPSGINKAVGIRRALDELGRSERNLIAFGDAENDIPMLVGAEFGVAARDSVPAVLSAADDRVFQPGGAGIAIYIRKLLEQRGIVRTPERRTIPLGETADGQEVTLAASGMNVVISGDPRSGKSWIAGLAAEQLIEQGYRLCIIDPEGDYAQMGQRAKIVTFGNDLDLPSPGGAAKLVNSEALSIVLTLAGLSPSEQISYTNEFLATIHEARAISGIPHWVIIDEAHYFFGSGSPCLKHLATLSGNFCLVTYRPSLLDEQVYGNIRAHIISGTTIEDERYFVTKLLQANGDHTLIPHTALASLEWPKAGLFVVNSSNLSWKVFTPAERITRHAHHARKYADSRLPDDRAFRFVNAGTPVVAHNISEFYRAIQTVPIASVRHHLLAGDFSRWASDVLGDQQLAKGLRKLERTTPAGSTPDRAEILAHVKAQYLIEGVAA
jgi:hypothetical protein